MTHSTKASQLPGDAAQQWLDEKPSVEEEARDAAQRSRTTGIKGNDVLLRLYRAGKILQPPPSVPLDGGEADLNEKFDMALREFTVERDDNLPLRFRGYMIGWNDVDMETPRGTAVALFATQGGKIVTSVHQWQKDTRRERERHDACVHDTAQDALSWLIKDGGGYLGKSSREAWELACQVWPPLQGKDVEVVE